MLGASPCLCWQGARLRKCLIKILLLLHLWVWSLGLWAATRARWIPKFGVLHYSVLLFLFLILLFFIFDRQSGQWERETERKVFLCRWFTLQWPLRLAHLADLKPGDRCFSWSLPWGAGPKHLGHPPLHSLATAESWPGRGATGTRTWCRRRSWRISLLSLGAGLCYSLGTPTSGSILTQINLSNA